MKIIEANAYRSWTLKLPKLDYRGEERFRPNEDATIHAGLRATIEEADDVAECQRQLDRRCEELVEAAKQRALAELKRALLAADNPAAAAQARPAPQPLLIQEDTLRELRLAKSRLEELTKEPVQVAVPKDEASGRELLANLRFEIKRLLDAPAQAQAPPSSPSGPGGGHAPAVSVPAAGRPSDEAHKAELAGHRPAGWGKADDELLQRPGVEVPAAKRACFEQGVHGKTPFPINAVTWDWCRRHGQLPRCLTCQDRHGRKT